MTFSFLIYLPLVVLSSLLLGRRIFLDAKAIGFLLLCFSYLLVYGLAGMYSDTDFMESYGDYLAYDRSSYFLIFAGATVVFIAFLVSLLGYRVARSKIGGGLRYATLDNMRAASLLSFIFCMVSIFVYAAQYGGIASALKYAAVIRAGHGLVEEGAKLTFLNTLCQLVPFLSFSIYINTLR